VLLCKGNRVEGGSVSNGGVWRCHSSLLGAWGVEASADEWHTALLLERNGAVDGERRAEGVPDHSGLGFGVGLAEDVPGVEHLVLGSDEGLVETGVHLASRAAVVLLLKDDHFIPVVLVAQRVRAGEYEHNVIRRRVVGHVAVDVVAVLMELDSLHAGVELACLWCSDGDATSE